MSADFLARLRLHSQGVVNQRFIDAMRAARNAIDAAARVMPENRERFREEIHSAQRSLIRVLELEPQVKAVKP